MDEKDPIHLFKNVLIQKGLITEEQFKEMDKEQREKVIAAMKFADESPWPNPMTLEQGVFAPEENG